MSHRHRSAVRTALGAALFVFILILPRPLHQTTLPPYTPPAVVSVQPKRVAPPRDALLCLAQTIFFEASIETLDGMEAVAATVFNRAASRSWPSTICGVVYQPRQFTWTLDVANWTRRPPARFIRLAKDFMARREEIRRAYPVTHFHHHSVEPAWAQELRHIFYSGHHTFYGV